MNKENRDHYMNHMFYGFDMDRTMLRIGTMNMMTHGVESPFIDKGNVFELFGDNLDLWGDIQNVINNINKNAIGA